MDAETEFGISEQDLGNLKLLFAHPGWGVLTDQLQKNVETLDTIRGVETEAALQYNKGQCAVLWNILNLPSLLELVEEAEADDKPAIAH